MRSIGINWIWNCTDIKKKWNGSDKKYSSLKLEQISK